MTDHRVTAAEVEGQLLDNEIFTAARLFVAEKSDAALSWLCPVESAEHQRVHLLVAVGAVLTGVAATGGAPFLDNAEGGPAEGPPGPVGVVTTALIDAGGRLDAGGIRDLITTHCTAATHTTASDCLLTEVVAELLRRFAVCTGVRG